MAGSFGGNVRPALPGAYFDFEVEQPQPNLVNPLGVVAVPFTHPWGPDQTVTVLNSFADFVSIFGLGGIAPPSYSPGYKAVRMAFTGEGLPGRGGASQVLAYRMTGSSVANATLTISNTAPAAALTITAAYPGTFGNKLAYTNVANATNPTTMHDFSVYVDGTKAETFTFAKTSIANLVTAINAGSKWITASLTLGGTPLAIVSVPVSLAGGNDGSTLASGDYTQMMTDFGSQRFSLFAPFDLEDSSILTSLVSWQAGLNSAGKRFMTVVGGASGDTASTAATRASGINDPNVVTLGVGTYSDSVIGTLNTAQLAPRLAGIMAARGDVAGLSFARMAGLSIIGGPSDSDILSSITAGWMAIARDSNAAAPVRFEKGVTTFIDPADDNRPFYVYSNPKFVRTMQDIELTITGWAESNVIGLLPVDSNTVNYVVGFVKSYFKTLEGNQIIQPGWTVAQNMNPPPTPTDDFISLVYGVTFTRDTEQVLNVVTVQ